MCSTLKVKKNSKIILGSPSKFAGLTQNRKKNYRNTKSINQNENVRKQSIFSTLKV
jgi:hypothetical protein